MVLFPSLMIDLSGILMLLYMTSSRIFENVTAKNSPKELILKNQSVTIAFFSLLLPYSSSFFLFLLFFSFASVISG